MTEPQTRIGNAYAREIKCRFCDYTTHRWRTLKNGSRKSGLDILEDHILDEHPHEWRRIKMPDYSNEPIVTRYIARPGSPVWVKIGDGWCAGYLLKSVRRKGRYRAIVKFETGAKELHEFADLRFRDGDSR